MIELRVYKGFSLENFYMKARLANSLDAFFDGFTGAGLFGMLRRPGAPTEFVDSRSLQEIRESGELAEYSLDRSISKSGGNKPNFSGSAAIRGTK